MGDQAAVILLVEATINGIESMTCLGFSPNMHIPLHLDQDNVLVNGYIINLNLNFTLDDFEALREILTEHEIHNSVYEGMLMIDYEQQSDPL